MNNNIKINQSDVNDHVQIVSIFCVLLVVSISLMLWTFLKYKLYLVKYYFVHNYWYYFKYNIIHILYPRVKRQIYLIKFKMQHRLYTYIINVLDKVKYELYLFKFDIVNVFIPELVFQFNLFMFDFMAGNMFFVLSWLARYLKQGVSNYWPFVGIGRE